MSPERGRPVGAPEFALWPVERLFRRYYTIVVVVASVSLTVNETAIAGLALEDWDWLFVSGIVVLLVSLRLALSLPDRAQETIDRLARRAVLVAHPAQLANFTNTLHRTVRSASLRWAAAIAGLIVLAWVLAFGARVGERVSTVAVEVIGGMFAGLFIGRAVGYGRLEQRFRKANLKLKVDPGGFDGAAGLRPIGQLYFFHAGVLAIPAGFLAVWWFLIPLYPGYAHWRNPYAILLVVAVGLELLAFLAPLTAFHRAMCAQKVELTLEADHHMQRAAAIQGELRSASQQEERKRLQDELDALRKRYDAIERMPTWPVDARLRRRFQVNNALLLLPVAGQLLGFSVFWQKIAENLQTAAGH
jgi:hypothetical protein